MKDETINKNGCTKAQAAEEELKARDENTGCEGCQKESVQTENVQAEDMKGKNMQTEEGNVEANKENVQTENVDESKESEIRKLKEQLENVTKQSEDYFNMLQRTAAEFDNYKKRTAREKENIYIEAVCDVVASFLPVVDNLERAVQAAQNFENVQSLKEGVEMIYKQIKDVMKSLDVKEIDCVGKPFNPEMHNAVIHINDEAYGENIVVEEFRKGYVLKDKVIRHSLVKVAN